MTAGIAVFLQVFFALPCESAAVDFDFEEVGIFEVLFHHDCRFGPNLVVVLSVDDEDFELRLFCAADAGEEKGCDECEDADCFHLDIIGGV